MYGAPFYILILLKTEQGNIPENVWYAKFLDVNQWTDRFVSCSVIVQDSLTQLHQVEKLHCVKGNLVHGR